MIMATEGVELVAVVAQYYGQTSATPVVRECVREKERTVARPPSLQAAEAGRTGGTIYVEPMYSYVTFHARVGQFGFF